MKSTLNHFVGPLLAVILLWYVAHFVLGLLGEFIVGGAYSDLLFPFYSSHALEEASEGLYKPMRDPRFVIYALLLGAIVFGGPSYWAVRGTRGRQVWLVAAAILFGLAFVTYRLQFIFGPGYPDAMLSAGIAMFCYFALAAAAGLAIAIVSHRGDGRMHG